MKTDDAVNRSGLNERQLEAVSVEDGSVAVYAGPGSGKTTVLTNRIIWLLQRGEPAENMLVVTFTRAAAREMEERLVQQLGPVRGLTIGTFHSVFLRLLREVGVAIPRLLDDREQTAMIRRLLTEMEQPDDEEAVAHQLSRIGFCKSNLIMPERMKVKKEQNIAFRRLFLAYEDKKEQQRVWDYDDILLRFYQQLQGSPGNFLRGRFSHILVDEFQDINRVQFEAVRLLLSEEGHLFAVGDDDQSIYGFRGSDPRYMIELPDRFPACRRVVLSTNYRSTERIIKTGQQLIAHNRHREPKRLHGTGIQGEAPRWLEAADEEDEARQILNLLQDGRETAILYRTSTQARALIDGLVREDIPFSVSPGDAGFYRRWQVIDVLSYLKLAENPDDLDALMRVINRPKRYLYGEEWVDSLWQLSQRSGASLLESLPRLKELKPYQKKYLQEMVRQVLSLRGLPLSQAVSRVRREIGYDHFLSTMAKDLGQDFAALLEPVEELSMAAESYTDAPDFLAHIQKVEQRIRQQPSTSQVHLMTLHKSKGLEFERVILIGLHGMVLPHHRSLQVPEKQKGRAWEEERRLLYVGITRAKEELVFAVSRTRQGKRVGPSPFLKELGLPVAAKSSPVRDEKPVSEQDAEQPQLRYGGEPIAEGDRLLHSRWGEGFVIGWETLGGTAPGRKVTLRFGRETRSLHYELSRQLGILDRPST